MSAPLKSLKTALVYDWFSDGAGGGEKVFEEIYKLFPAPIYTLLKTKNSLKNKAFEKEKIFSSLIEKLPFSTQKYRSYLFLFPIAIEQLNLSSYDLIISCSHCVAKGVLTHADQIHLCYCYTPMRYGWDLYHDYIEKVERSSRIKSFFAKIFIHYLRLWDFHSAQRVDAYSAISLYVAKRIQKTYGKKATVIYPPVNTDFFTLELKKEDYYLAASRLVSYKKIELIVEAFNEMPDKELIVIGDGPDLKKIKKKAGKNIKILGFQSDETLKKYYQKAKAFLFAAIEDFGIMPVEAQACGTPVIALGKGGALETIREGVTGLFFHEQTKGAIQQAVAQFESKQHLFEPTNIRNHAERFNTQRFLKEFSEWVIQKTS